MGIHEKKKEMIYFNFVLIIQITPPKKESGGGEMRVHNVFFSTWCCAALFAVSAAPPDGAIFDGSYHMTGKAFYMSVQTNQHEQVGGAVTTGTDERRGCDVDSDTALLVYGVVDGRGYPYVYTMNLDRKDPNQVPTKIVKFVTRRNGITGFTADRLSKNVYVSYRDDNQFLFKIIKDYTSVVLSADFDKRVVPIFDPVPASSISGGCLAVLDGRLYILHTVNGKHVLSYTTQDGVTPWKELAFFSGVVPGGHKLLTMVFHPHPTPQLHVTAVGDAYPGDMYSVDPKTETVVKVAGIVTEAANQPAISIGNEGRGVATLSEGAKYFVYGLSLPDPGAIPADRLTLNKLGPSEAPIGPICYAPIDDCLQMRYLSTTACQADQVCADEDEKANDVYQCFCKPPLIGPVGNSRPTLCQVSPCEAKPCGDTQRCVDSPVFDTTYTCECIAPLTGDPKRLGLATCVGDDCAGGECGASQDCVDTVPGDGQFACNCRAPQTGTAQGAQAVCVDGGDDDCTMSGCDAGQKCVDEDKTKDGMFKCDCPDGQTGMQGVSAPATMCVGGDDCVSGCDAGQKCVDADMTKDGMFTCDCPDGQTGMQGVNAPATMCVGTIVMGDCDGDPCGTDQDCEDTDMPGDGKYSCKCRLPQTGDVAVGMKATCTNRNDDCSEQPTRCGEFQTCEDADKTVDNVFACKCTSGTGEDGVNQPGKCTDCLMKDQCGTGQTCTDTDGSVDTVFTCDCVAPATGTAVGKPATCTKLDCEPNPCGDYSTCTDTQGTTDDKLFTCVCIADHSRHQSATGAVLIRCPAPPTPIPDEEDDGGFLLGLIIGTASAFFLCLIVGALVYCFCCRKKKGYELEPYRPEEPFMDTKELTVIQPDSVLSPDPHGTTQETHDYEYEEVEEVEEIIEEETEEEDDDIALDDSLSDIEQAPLEQFHRGFAINSRGYHPSPSRIDRRFSPPPSSGMRSPGPRSYQPPPSTLGSTRSALS